MIAFDFEGKRYDVGEKVGFVKTTVEFAMQNEEIRKELLDYLNEILEKSQVGG